MKWPGKKYKTIYADPPWPERGGGRGAGARRQGGRYCPTARDDRRYLRQSIKRRICRENTPLLHRRQRDAGAGQGDAGAEVVNNAAN